MSQNYDLNALIEHEHTSITIQKMVPENSDDANLRRLKEKAILFCGLGILVSLFLTCIVFIIKNPANALAMNTAFGIGSGFAGYILRGKTS